MMFSNQPMNPQELAVLHRRMGIAEDTLSGPMPTDIGSGLQRLGTAMGLAAMRARYNSQFPAAPAAPGGSSAPKAMSPFQRIAEALSGDTMPWQFPAAPSLPGAPAGAAARDTTGWNLPATSLRQGDRQQPPIPVAPPPEPASVTSTLPFSTQNTSGGMFGFFKPPAPSGLW